MKRAALLLVSVSLLTAPTKSPEPEPSSFLLPKELPKARGNAVGDAIAAAKLGFQVFFDARFSRDQQMRCATCHLPEANFHDRRPTSIGFAGKILPRNSPTILNAAWNTADFFWDGRADSLWSQALFAFESPDEMATTRLELAHSLSKVALYRRLYEDAFGAIADLTDTRRFPATGRPGDASFDAMAAGDQETINRIVANLGKALEAYMRRVATGPSRFDRYLGGDASAVDDGVREGFRVFLDVGCARCHSGPSFSDGRFHAMTLPRRPDDAPDRGRADGLEIQRQNPFNRFGPYHDADPSLGRPKPMETATPADVGALRTPTLRNIGLTAPYGHDGRASTLAALLEQHGDVRLSAKQINRLQVFLLSLNGSYPERPWNNWPAN